MALLFRKPSAVVGSMMTILPDEVHVWGVDLSVDEIEGASLGQCLAPDELERAKRFVVARQRHDFVAAHHGMRAILSRYCGQNPKDLRFQRSASGKPFLEPVEGRRALLRFSLTHSHGRALVAVASQREVGVDLESLEREVDPTTLAQRFFSEQDQAIICQGELSERLERFFRIWVAREAAGKAKGTGLTFPLDRHYVELSPDGSVLVVGDGEDRSLPIRFLHLEAGWVGAVAAEGHDWRVVLCGES